VYRPIGRESPVWGLEALQAAVLAFINGNAELVNPSRLISSMIGRTLAANRLAFAFTAAVPRFAALDSSGLPSRVPRALAAARSALQSRPSFNERNVRTGRGGRWTRVQVGAVLARDRSRPGLLHAAEPVP
jgi:hypothetical protein